MNLCQFCHHGTENLMSLVYLSMFFYVQFFWFESNLEGAWMTCRCLFSRKDKKISICNLILPIVSVSMLVCVVKFRGCLDDLPTQTGKPTKAFSQCKLDIKRVIYKNVKVLCTSIFVPLQDERSLTGKLLVVELAY
jgi:hypothetical protein